MTPEQYIKFQEEEIRGLKKFVNFHISILVLAAVVICAVGLIMVARLRVTPADVYGKLGELEKSAITKEQIEEIISTNAPWSIDRDEWREWRDRVDMRLEAIEKNQHQ